MASAYPSLNLTIPLRRLVRGVIQPLLGRFLVGQDLLDFSPQDRLHLSPRSWCLSASPAPLMWPQACQARLFLEVPARSSARPVPVHCTLPAARAQWFRPDRAWPSAWSDGSGVAYYSFSIAHSASSASRGAEVSPRSRVITSRSKRLSG